MPSRDPRIWMWEEAREMLERAERMHRQFFRLAPSPTGLPRWEPPLDMLETAHDLWILVALPGVRAEQIQISILAGALTVRGERTLPAGTRAALIHRIEIPHGRFERHIELPPGRYELERQELADGCLTLRLRKL
ncbi:MAG: Hsp20/alpha crystallin family protein [Gammaproteobacteria bacterium]|nr:Hsp20/alpha crystallin family protein [Gammaproteobacteria bacterium]